MKLCRECVELIKAAGFTVTELGAEDKGKCDNCRKNRYVKEVKVEK